MPRKTQREEAEAVSQYRGPKIPPQTEAPARPILEGINVHTVAKNRIITGDVRGRECKSLRDPEPLEGSKSPLWPIGFQSPPTSGR